MSAEKAASIVTRSSKKSSPKKPSKNLECVSIKVKLPTKKGESDKGVKF